MLYKKYRNRFMMGLVFVIIILLMRIFHITDYLTIEQFKNNRINIKLMVDHNYLASVIIYILAYVTVVSLSIPLAAVLTIISGFLFGVIYGAIYSNIGATIGATIAFLVVRYILGDFIQERYLARLENFNKEIELHGAWYLLAIHVITLVPFFVVNTLAGLTRMSIWTFIWTTLIGVIPGSLLYAYAGRKLMTIESIKEIFSPEIIIIFSILFALSIVAVFLKKISKKANIAK